VNRPVVDFLPTTDPLLRHPRLEYSVELPVLGLATRFESNSRYVLGVVDETFGSWGALTAETLASDAPLRITIIVHDDVERSEPPSPVRHISTDDDRLLVHSPGSVAVVDPLRRQSLAYVTTRLAADRGHFRETVLEAITFALLTGFDRHPIHAAAIARDGRALLLAAPSGTGKSTLAYLAHRSGIAVLGDDHVWVQLEPALRIWGSSPSVRLLDGASEHFPELSEGEEQKAGPSLRSGRQKQTISIGMEPTTCDRANVCVMARGAEVALERIEGSQLAQELARQLSTGFDRFGDRHDVVVRALTADGGWRLTLSDDPFDALPLLQRMLGER
jgi:hypothetical protein